MLEMHLRQPGSEADLGLLQHPRRRSSLWWYLTAWGLTYSACELFTKNKERIHIFKETGGS